MPISNKIYPRTGDTQTVYLKNVITNPNIKIGDYTMYNDFVNDPKGFEQNNVLYHYPINHDKLIIGKFCSIACGAKFLFNSARESNYQPFAIYKEQVLKLLADTNMTQSKKEDLIVALFAYVQGLTTLATMENVHYAYKWEDKLTDLIGIFSCEF